MRMVQEIFWGEGERVVQRNPRFKLHGHGLHLWKENGTDTAAPPEGGK